VKETLSEFMDRYLKEKNSSDRALQQARLAFSEQFYADEYLNQMRRFMTATDDHKTTVERIEESGDSGTAVVREWFGREQRFRYHLFRFNAKWRILGSDWECFACKGAASKGSTPCRLCQGEGWRKYNNDN
jgi:hypothetical protein